MSHEDNTKHGKPEQAPLGKNRKHNKTILGIIGVGALVGLIAILMCLAQQQIDPREVNTVGTRTAPDVQSQDETARIPVVVADLEGDRKKTTQKRLLTTLTEFDGIRVLPFENSKSETVMIDTNAAALSFLKNSDASIMIWGTMTDPERDIARLFVTVMSQAEANPPDTTIALPLLPWSELIHVLRLAIAIAEVSVGTDSQHPDIGDLSDLIAAVQSLSNENHRSEWSPETHGQVLMLLADALRLYARISEKIAPLEEAVTTYRMALDVYSQAQMPLEWAIVQNNLGVVLQDLGEHEGGTEHLQEAVAAYQAVLEVYTQEQTPLEWAIIQHNLGAALRALGERAGDQVLLEDAVASFRASLAVYTREQMPMEWAITQNNIGKILTTLGEQNDDLERLQAAVAAYEAALTVRTREQVPMEWAITQHNLGAALRALGEREDGTERLEEAVVAYEAALEVRTREQTPLDWAKTMNNLGAALRALGEREQSTVRLEEAVVAYEAALTEYSREKMPLDWATAQNNLGAALWTLGKRESGTARLQAAVAAYEAALTVRTRAQTPLDFAVTQYNLGTVLQTLGKRDDGTEILQAAIAAYEAALEVFDASDAQYFAEATRTSLSLAEALVAERTQE